MATKRTSSFGMSEAKSATEIKRKKYGRFQYINDIVLLNVQDETFSVSAEILCKSSEVFKTMLESTNFKEGLTRKIEFPGKSADEVYMLLNTLDPCPENPMLIDPKVLLPLAEEYQIETVKEECRRQLLLSVRDGQSGADLETVHLAELFGLTDVFSQAVSKCCKQNSINDVASYKEYIQQIRPETRERLNSAILLKSADALKLQQVKFAEEAENHTLRWNKTKFRSEVVQQYLMDLYEVLKSVQSTMKTASTTYTQQGGPSYTVSWTGPPPNQFCLPTSVSGDSQIYGAFHYKVDNSDSLYVWSQTSANRINFKQAASERKENQPHIFSVP